MQSLNKHNEDRILKKYIKESHKDIYKLSFMNNYYQTPPPSCIYAP